MGVKYRCVRWCRNLWRKVCSNPCIAWIVESWAIWCVNRSPRYKVPIVESVPYVVLQTTILCSAEIDSNPGRSAVERVALGKIHQDRERASFVENSWRSTCEMTIRGTLRQIVRKSIRNKRSGEYLLQRLRQRERRKCFILPFSPRVAKKK